MATDRPRRRKSAAPPERKTVKTTLIVGVDLHARWSAAASLRGMDRNAFAVEALSAALRGLVIIDRRASAGSSAAGEGFDGAEAA